MNGNRLTLIHTSAVSQDSPCVQGLDYHGRKRADDIGNQSGPTFFDFVPRTAGLTVFMGFASDRPLESALMASGLEALQCGLGECAEVRPASIVQSINRSACGAAAGDSYATLFYASVDPLRRELRYVNAGHEPALLLRKRQNRAIALESTGTVLGLTPRSSYGQRNLPLEPGDVLAVFSESVAETVDTLGRPFGFAGVLGVLRRFPGAHAFHLVEEILSAAERYAGWGLPSADQAVAAVRFTGSIGEAHPLQEETEISVAAA